jgi:asparagine synthase (glutamine-hydrolysing)
VFESDFAGSARHRRARIDETAARRLQRTRGRELVERYWGRYVAFIHDAEAATTWILRDPSGDLDCMMTEHRGVRIFFSLMEDCPPLDRLSFSVNWDYVAMFVSAPPSEGYQTGLREISRVLAGECMTMRRDGSSREFYWDPFDIVAAERIDNPDHAAPLLHETTVACVHAWASCYERILNLLSGGLDSSIIVGCLKTAASKPAVTNFHTYYSAGSGSDERSYARAAAELAGYAMLENEMDPDVNLQDIYTTPPTATPVSTFIELGILARRRRACAELGIRGVFRGSGGDQLFFQNGSQYVCADYIFERGVRPGLFRVALDAAYMENDVVWALLLRGLRDANSREPLNLLLGKLVVSEILAYDARACSSAATVLASVVPLTTASSAREVLADIWTLDTLRHEQHLRRPGRPGGCSSASVATVGRIVPADSDARACERRSRPGAGAPRIYSRGPARHPQAPYQG